MSDNIPKEKGGTRAWAVMNRDRAYDFVFPYGRYGITSKQARDDASNNYHKDLGDKLVRVRVIPYRRKKK